MEEKQQHEYFKQHTEEITRERTKTRLRSGNLKGETKYLLIAALNDALRTICVKALIICIKIASADYVLTEIKQLITS